MSTADISTADDLRALAAFTMRRLNDEDDQGLGLAGLADIEARRQLVTFWSHAYRQPTDYPGADWDRVRSNARWTVQLLAARYAEHPDYLRRWAPSTLSVPAVTA